MSEGGRTPTSLTLTTGGITILSVIASIGVTVGFGVSGEWWLRVAAGLAVAVGLTLGVKLGTRAGHGPLARAAAWVIGSEER